MHNNIIERFDKFTEEAQTNISETLGIEKELIIFMDNSISFANYFELYHNEVKGMTLKMHDEICEEKKNMVSKIIKYWDALKIDFYHYIHIKNQMSTNYFDIPKQIIDVMVDYIEKRQETEYEFVLPFKERIARSHDKDYQKSLMEELTVPFDYVITFSFVGNKNKFTYYIEKIFKDEMCVIIKTDEVNNYQARSFVESLMHYGNIKI